MREHYERLRIRALWSWQGLKHIWRTEGSLHQWMWANIISAALAFALPITAGERGMLLMGGVMVLAFECLNTAIERVVDDVSEERRALAKQAKDSGSAAVAVAGAAVGLAWLCVLGGLVL
ncbi:diacylglycerol kinase [Limimaricola cinnabarinus]|jgi:diacylglycerol kinase (ATP)|uniref:Diacylglycerol kinase n=1 Tax=Limimaricola cinnabarinus TaxID=1125964 RepID=A0A2G1MF07_9RHOB|nr:diacylglycerol kinase [Limimaricola cinnabarinus]PHP27277.1 diacylglycerol kinase [Limimaricola cinnabarinus]